MKPVKKTDQEKAWAKRTLGKKAYQEYSREQAKVFLIICEGMNTEPLYFKAFPLGNAKVDSYGLGSSKTALVEYVIQNVVSDRNNTDKEIWVVFDFDIKPDQVEQQKEDYNRAIELAANKGIKVAYSNDSFELWFLLHYQYLELKWTRHQYYQKLEEWWECNYEKEGKKSEFCRKIYQKLKDDPRADQTEALNRASRLFEQQAEVSFAERNPCTTVYDLVKALNEYL
ncbi:RloB family protein [Haliscomenobacter hydrossis]|uniref:Abortive phage resistance protein n=1 Tax=Haliscomenobacter hydrossis (strain ATCC 27775 / DSM 1100 / LMG 10767 / O) TaxID=760192 RepID=F4KVX0_HALH1|nr:RloB family protein [Haliscomenobacter hydrossis]AEE53545.1 abortive phage resistance protein [Haliscomenobacter hydrossis DSM 1100]